MEDTNKINKESSYDQKAFLQIRLHELLKRIDSFNGNPNFWNPTFNAFHYQIIYNDLCSVLQTISSKLSPDEKKKGLKLRTELSRIINKPTSFKDARQRGTIIDISLKQNIQDKLFLFRMFLEDCMDSHGFNPSKDDLSKSIIDM